MINNTLKVLFFAFITISFNLKADTIVSFADLEFHSDFEKQAFYKYENTYKPDYFALYLATDSEVDSVSYYKYKFIIDNRINAINNPKFQSYSNKKKIKKVFAAIHDQMLDKYVEKAIFSDIFLNGSYQCVSSSMLYSYVFDNLKIPYEIEFEPGHVFLITYPESSKIVVQTTNPMKGVMIYDQNFKSKYVNYLRDNKLIGSSEYRSKSVDELFKAYYLKSEKGNKARMVSAIYQNQGLYFLQSSDFNSAYQALAKAYYLWPDINTKYLFRLALALKIDNTNASDSQYAKLLSMFAEISGKSITTDVIVGLFQNMTNSQLNVEGNVQQYKRSYLEIKNRISDSAAISNIDFFYNVNMGILESDKKNYRNAQQFYERAYDIKPKNKGLQSSLLATFINRSLAYANNEEYLVEFVEELDAFVGRHEEMLDNGMILNLLMNSNLGLMHVYFLKNDEADAIKYMKKFEEMADNSKDALSIDIVVQVEKSYAAGASFYFKKYKYKTAKSILKKGIGYAPKSYLLKSRLETLNSL